MSVITIAFLVSGLLVGMYKGAGIFILMSTLGAMWFGNAISGLLTGKIQTLAGMHADVTRIVERAENPFDYFVEVAFEGTLGTMALIYFFNNF